MNRTTLSDDPLVVAFEKMLENNFTKLILAPLLKSRGFTRIQFHGGPTENGKDLIAFKKDSFGSEECSVFVVKKLRASAAANRRDTFHASVTQLQQAAESKIPFLDGVSRKPTEVVFVTPHVVSVKMLETRFNRVIGIRKNRLKYLDGELIASLLRESCPAICNMLLEVNENVTQALEGMYTNEAVLKLLGASSDKTIDCFHVGLDFWLGNKRFLQLLNTSYQSSTSLTIAEGDERLQFYRSLQIQAATDLITQIEVEVATEGNEKTTSAEASSLLASEQLKQQQAELDSYRRIINQAVKEIESQIKICIANKRECEIAYCALKRKFTGKSYDESRDFSSNTEHTAFVLASEKLEALEKKRDILALFEQKRNQVEIQQLNFEDRSARGGIAPAEEHTIASLKKYARDLDSLLHKTLPELTERAFISRSFNAIIKIRLQFLETPATSTIGDSGKVELQVRYVVNTAAFAGVVAKAQIACRRALESASSSNICSETFASGFSHFGTNAILLDRLVERGCRDGLIAAGPVGKASKPCRLPLESLLSSRQSILLLGEAGSGKSTSLQAYTKKLVDLAESGTFVIYAPLGSVAQHCPQHALTTEDLLNSLVCFLNVRGACLDVETLRSHLNKKTSVIVLDAIDEATARCPAIGVALAELCAEYNQCQFVVSSRELGPVARTLGLAPVTLRPFSSTQLRQFIELYCQSREKPDATIKIFAHISSKRVLQRILKTPLLATILCEIHFAGAASLPSTELQLYRQRFKMMSGSLDDAKRIDRRIASSQDDLEIACRKIAFALHLKFSRYATPEEHVETLLSDVSLGWTRKRAALVVEELLNPCQLLVLMAEGRLVGFGHLRFQEYFAAQELLNMQTTDVARLLQEVAWRDIFVIYALSSSSILRFFENLKIKLLGDVAKITLSRMVSVLSNSQRRSLKFGTQEVSESTKAWVDSMLAD